MGVKVVQFVIDVLVILVGLRGGPLEEKKRRWMGPLLCVLCSLVLVNIGIGMYESYLLIDSGVDDTCWSENPCVYVQRVTPEVCGVTSVSDNMDDACVVVAENWPVVLDCLRDYFVEADAWLSRAYDDMFIPPYNMSTMVGCVLSDGVPNEMRHVGSEINSAADGENNSTAFSDASAGEETERILQYVLQNTQLRGDAMRNLILLYQQGVHFYAAGDPFLSVPWAFCLNYTSCGSLLYNNTCHQWGDLLTTPYTPSTKDRAIAINIIGWIGSLITVLSIVIAFNWEPDYRTLESWKGTVETFGRLFFCHSALEDAATRDGVSAKEGIGELLYKLFGGIDTDLTDKILGMYLAGERVRWRRQEHICRILNHAGFVHASGKTKTRASESSQKSSCCLRFYKAKEEGNSLATFLDDSSSIATSMSVMDRHVSGEGHLSDERHRSMHQARMQCSTDVIRDLGHQEDDGSRDLSLQKDAVSRRIDDREHLNDSCSKEDAMDASSMIDETSMDASTFLHIQYSLVAKNAEDGSLDEESIVQESRRRPLVTPVDISHINFDPPLSNRDAAKVYMPASSLVPAAHLKDALKYVCYAKAAYGLQDGLWKKAKSGNVIVDTFDSVVTTCGSVLLKYSPLGRFGLRKSLDMSRRFRKKNFMTILKYTELKAEDFLYVSYSSTSFGMVPYMVMLDRRQKQVILSVRGTVGASDLITDLLSTSISARPILPASMLQEFDGINSDSLASNEFFGHEGIISSSRAVFDDLQANGLVQAMTTMTTCDMSGRTGSLSLDEDNLNHLHSISDMKADDEITFPIERAKCMLYQALAQEGWDLIVTGHSLGAAVACSISFQLREHCPKLRCYAFNPPGGLFSPQLSAMAKEFCTSVVVGYDGISRLGLHTVREFVDDMVFALARCKRPKLAILSDVVLGRRIDPSTAPPTFCGFEDVSEDVLAMLQQYLDMSELHAKDVDLRPLCPPGSVIFLRPYLVNSATKKKVKEIWDAVYMDPNQIMKEGLILAKGILRHHKMSVLQAALENALERVS